MDVPFDSSPSHPLSLPHVKREAAALVVKVQAGVAAPAEGLVALRTGLGRDSIAQHTQIGHR